MQLSEWRKQKGVTLKAVADEIGSTAATLSRIERGVHRPSGRTIRAIQEFTKGAVQPNDFYPPDAA
jgi:transcriptional regulator with XRE-family HTH domain